MITNCYIICMEEKGPLAEWFEKKYLEWQLENGRKSLDEFSKYLSISRGYVSQIMNGDRKTIGLRSALHIADVLDDTTILDILSYPNPKEGAVYIPGYPHMSKMLTEAFATMRARGVDDDSPEAVQILRETALKYGIEVKSDK